MRKILEDWKNAVTVHWFLAGMGIYLIAVAVLAYWFLAPLRSQYTELIDNRESLENTYINLIQLDIEESIRSVDHILEKLETYQNQFDARLLQEPNLNALMPVLDGYCTSSHLKVLTLEPLNKVQEVTKDYQKLYAQLRLTGRYVDFLDWFKKLEGHPQWILIEKLSIEPTDLPEIQNFTVEISVLRDRRKK